MAGAVPHHKLRAPQGLLGYSVPLQDGQGAEGIIVKPDGLGVPGIDHHSLGRGVLAVIIRRLFLGHHIGSGEQLGQHDLPVDIGGVEAVAGGHALVVRGQLPVGGHHLELRPGQGLTGHAVILLDDQTTLAGVFDHHSLGVAALPNDHVGGGRVDDVPAVRGLDLIDHISTGSQIGDLDLTLSVGGEDAVLGQGRRADDPVQPHLAASGGGDSELRAGKHLIGLAVPFLDDQAAFRLIFKGKRHGFTRLNLDGLTLGIDQETSGGAHLGDYHALSRLQTGDADLPVLIGAVDAVGVADQGPVRVHDLELGVLEGHAGVGGADLPNEQDAVRGVVEGDRDHILLTLVGNIDRFRGIDNGVPVRRVDLLHDIGAGSQPGPDGGPVLARHLRADDRAASAAGPAQIFQLEGAAGKGLMGHAVVFLHHNGV